MAGQKLFTSMCGDSPNEIGSGGTEGKSLQSIGTTFSFNSATRNALSDDARLASTSASGTRVAKCETR